MTATITAATSLSRALVKTLDRSKSSNAVTSIQNRQLRWISTTTTAKQPLPPTRLHTQQWRQGNGIVIRRQSTSSATSSSNNGSNFAQAPASQQHQQQQQVTLEENGVNIFATTTTTSTTTTTAPADAAITSSSSLMNVVRHGPGDGVICLNVGGTEFWTLRSTIASNSVLADHVIRAQANHELTREGGAVFIDRDPCQFDIILQHLRNKVEGLSYNDSTTAATTGAIIKGKLLLSKSSSTRNHPEYADISKTASTKSRFTSNRPKTYVQLPKESEKLRDLYVEATHYRIPELQAALCEQSLWVTFASAFAGGGNPFDAASQLLKHLRRGLIATGGLGTLFIGTDLGKVFDLEWMQQKMGVKSKKKEEDGKKEEDKVEEGEEEDDSAEPALA